MQTIFGHVLNPYLLFFSMIVSMRWHIRLTVYLEFRCCLITSNRVVKYPEMTNHFCYSDETLLIRNMFFVRRSRFIPPNDFNHVPYLFWFYFLVRSSVGVELWHATNTSNVYTPNDKFARDESKFCRAIEFSPDGRYLAWANGSKWVHKILSAAQSRQIPCLNENFSFFFPEFKLHRSTIGMWFVHCPVPKQSPSNSRLRGHI